MVQILKVPRYLKFVAFENWTIFNCSNSGLMDRVLKKFSKEERILFQRCISAFMPFSSFLTENVDPISPILSFYRSGKSQISQKNLKNLFYRPKKSQPLSLTCKAASQSFRLLKLIPYFQLFPYFQIGTFRKCSSGLFFIRIDFLKSPILIFFFSKNYICQK